MTPPKRSSQRKPAAPKRTSKKTAAAKKTTGTRSAGAKKASPRKTAARKTAARAGVAKKTVKKTTPKKTVAKKTAKKGAAKKTAAKKAVARKTPAKKSAAPARSTSTATSAAGAAASRSGSAGGGPKRRAGRPAKLDAKALAQIRKLLEVELTELRGQFEELDRDSFEASQSDMTGEVGLDEDFADAGAATFDRERDLSILNNIQDLIDQITRALGRIDEGTYGTCERCARPIDAARLKALPHASLCMDCKRREERMR